MKNTIALLFLLISFFGMAQKQVQCGDAISKTDGTLVDSSSVQPRMKTENSNNLTVGTMGELALLSIDGNFSMTFSIGVVRIIASENNELTFEVVEKLGVVTINGVERSNFKESAMVRFTEYKYDSPHFIENKWPNGTIKETGYVLCDHIMGEWKEFHDNGVQKASYRTDKNGDIEGRYTEYHPNKIIAMEGEYRYGKKGGLWTEYYDTGEILSQGYYYDGKKSGKWIEHDATGKKVKKKY